MAERKHDKKPDLRDQQQPVSVTDIERKDPLGETPPAEVYDPKLVTPGPGNVPEGQTTKE